MINAVIQALRHSFSPEWATFWIAALPVAELRGAIPVGVAMGLSLKKAFFWACLGNILPIAPTLLLLDPISRRLRRFPLWSRFFDWWLERTRSQAKMIEKYEAVGLSVFVAVPLPGTGAWTGCMAASLFKIPFWLAFLSIASGVLGAGIIVSAAVSLGLWLIQ